MLRLWLLSKDHSSIVPDHLLILLNNQIRSRCFKKMQIKLKQNHLILPCLKEVAVELEFDQVLRIQIFRHSCHQDSCKLHKLVKRLQWRSSMITRISVVFDNLQSKVRIKITWNLKISMDHQHLRRIKVIRITIKCSKFLHRLIRMLL